MQIEDDEPRPRTALLAPAPLDRLGVAELRGYIEQLRAEIGRVEAEIVRKDGIRNAADSVFRRPG